MQYELVVKRYICRVSLLALECLGKFCSTSRGKDEIFFFYNCQKNVTFMHRYQVAKYVIFDSEKIFVKKFPWMLK
jgi:hypothetical protein